MLLHNGNALNSFYFKFTVLISFKMEVFLTSLNEFSSKRNTFEMLE